MMNSPGFACRLLVPIMRVRRQEPRCRAGARIVARRRCPDRRGCRWAPFDRSPAGTPAAIVERLNREINDVAKSPELGALLELDGTVPAAISPGAFREQLVQELAQWKRVAAEHHIVAE